MMRIPLSIVVLALLATDFARTAARAADRPNIIIMMADDMGYSDLGCYGGEIKTPHLDALAAGGLRFTQFYNTARCCPTRAALLTGLHQHQAGIGHMTGDHGAPGYRGKLNDRCVTIAEALKPAGYRCLTVGKWHVGSPKGHWPLDRGFDRFFGTPSGGGVYFKDAMQIRTNVFFTLGNERVDVPDDFYVTDAFTDHAMKFVDEAAQTDQPFFLYFAHIAPHWPLQAKPEDIAKYAGAQKHEKEPATRNNMYSRGWDRVRAERYRKQIEMGIVKEDWKLSPRDPAAKPWSELSDAKRSDLAFRMAVYAAQINSIDQNVGRLVAKLKALGEFENTVILFLSDNGCSAEGGPGGFSRGKKGAPIGTGLSYASAGLEWANVSDTPYRQYKMSTHEGGIATPLMAHWPAGLKRRGELEHQPSHVIDLMPTCVELAGATYPKEHKGKAITPVEGRSLVPTFTSKKIARDDALYWEHQGNQAIRDGQWKLVRSNGQPWELYDLENDRTELNDLAGKHPQRVATLKAKYQAWMQRADVLPWSEVRKSRRK